MTRKSILNFGERYKRITHSLLKYGAAAILVAVPLYPKFPFLSIPGTRVAIRLEDFLILIVFIIWFFYILPSFRELISNNIFKAMCLFWAIGLFSLFSAIFLTQTAAPLVGLLSWGRRIQYMVCFFIGMSALRQTRDLMFFLKCLIIDVFYVFTVGIGQEFFHWPVITTQNDEYSKGLALFFMKGGHLVSTFAGHYDMAAFLLLVLPIFITLIFANRKVLTQLFEIKKIIVSRFILIAASFAGLWLLTQTASRISIASYFGIVTIALLLNRKFKVLPVVLFVSLVFTLYFGGSLTMRFTNLIDVVVKKITTIELISESYAANPAPIATPVVLVTPTPTATPVPLLEDRSTNIRLVIEWPRAIRALSKNPFLGTGYSSITLATDNDYLRMLGETGIFGALSFSLVFLRILLNILSVFRAKKHSIEKMYVYSILAGLAGILLNMVFIDLLEASKFAIVFWLLLGFSVSAALINKNEA